MSKKEAHIIRTARLKLRRRHEKDIPFMLNLFNNQSIAISQILYKKTSRSEVKDHDIF